jgi:DNA-binding Lrp family transcriptional regulator
MPDPSASAADRAILEDLVTSGFPVDAKPYCVVAGRLDMLEGDVLESVLGMRMGGTIERIGASFDGGRCTGFSDDELVLVDVLAGDLPYSENPFAEVAAEFQNRGLDVDEAWVLERTAAWVESGVIVSFGVTLAPGEAR